jgi:hypothetical protein
MSVGTYSPTVQYAYKNDRNWFENYRDPTNPHYDLDGFDLYGYDKNGVDRAGNTQYDYQESEISDDGSTLYIDVHMDFVNYNPAKGGM